MTSVEVRVTHSVDLVDFLSISADGSEVEMTISDDMDWSDPEGHLAYLQDKVYRYLDFVASGEIHERYPRARGLRLIIRIRMDLEPPATAGEVIERIAKTAREEGVGMEVRVSGSRPKQVTPGDA